MEKKAAAAVASSSSPLPSERRDSSEPKYKGVRKRKWGKWVAEIRLPNSRERIWLGSHNSPEKAARAFDAALYCLRGRGAKFNFPDTPLILGGGEQSLTQQEIQAVAAKFANEGPAGFNHDRTMHGESSSTAVMEEENNYTSSSSECGAAQGEMNSDVAMDWSFLNTLDHGDYFGMGHHMDGGYYPPPPLPTPDINGDDGDDEAYSHPSSLWDWNF